MLSTVLCSRRRRSWGRSGCRMVSMLVLLGLPLSAVAAQLNIAGIHCFTFNSVEATEAWRQKSLARLA